MTSPIRTLYNAKEGAISVLSCVLIPVAIGFVALGVDTGIWYSNQRDMQAATDIATLSAVKEVGNVQDFEMITIVKSEAARNGFSESDGISFTINTPPLSGPYAGNTNALEVELSKSEERFFSMLHSSSDPAITTRAVALKTTSGEACILALDPTANGAVTFQGNPDVDLDGCIIATNSNSSASIEVGGSASLSADSLHTVGGYSVFGAATMNLDDPAVTNGPAINDPYADLPDPSYGGCDYNNTQAKKTVTLSPGVYCGNLKINANANVTLQSGTYYISGGDLTINGNANVTGNGVTIILTGTGSNVGNITVNGTANLDLTAPSSGTYEGILLYQDRDAPTSGNNKINGGSTNTLNGTIYFPNQEIEFSGNSANASSCLRMVARLIEFRGNSGMSHNCDSVGGENITTSDTITLVE